MSATIQRTLPAAALGLLALSCATYPDRTHRALADFQRGQLTRALDAYQDPHTTGSPFLAGAESGTVALASGSWDAAIKNRPDAVTEVKDLERTALVSPENLGETLVSWTVSESATTYQGEGYERVLVHAGLAIAYIAKGSLED